MAKAAAADRIAVDRPALALKAEPKPATDRENIDMQQAIIMIVAVAAAVPIGFIVLFLWRVPHCTAAISRQKALTAPAADSLQLFPSLGGDNNTTAAKSVHHGRAEVVSKAFLRTTWSHVRH